MNFLASGDQANESVLYRDFQELLYRAYLEDRKIIQRLRDKLKDPDYISDLEMTLMQDWQNINPRSIDPRKQGRSKYYPNSHDPQQGVRVYEDRNPKAMKKLREIIDRRNKNINIKITNKITENHLSEILKRTDFTDLTQYLDARAAADAKVLKQNKRLSL